METVINIFMMFFWPSQIHHLYAEQLQSLHDELQLLIGQLVHLHFKNRDFPTIVLLLLSFFNHMSDWLQTLDLER